MTTPYYRDDMVTLYHGDCREIPEWWRDADVLITDPPYGTAGELKRGADGYGRRVGNQRAAERVGQHIAGDADTVIRDWALSIWYTADRTRAALVFGSPRLPDPPGQWADRLVWDKRRPGTNGGPWRYRHESIYVTTGFNRTSDAAVSILSAFPEQKDHIHGKPLGLMVELVAAAPSGIIADPFAGSGSTLVAAARLGRPCIGVEIDERYCEIAARRLDQGVLDFGAAV